MGRAFTKLKKLKGRGREELRVRALQAAHAFAERRGWSAQARPASDARLLALLDPAVVPAALRSADGLVGHFRARTSPRFFAAFDDRNETRRVLRARFGGGLAAPLLDRARRAAAGRFDLLGWRDLDFGASVDWHLEPVADRRAPLKHWSEIDYLDARVVGDKKITWELNRCQHFVTLGRAYWHTGDETFARAYAAQLSSWMDANPPKFGINWASSLEVAFRAISWLWALHLFRDSEHLTPALFARTLKFLHAHARHVETYRSTYFAPNTHLTGEALALLYLGAQLPEFRASRRWRETGRRVLVEQLARQVRPDGVYFEQSTYYHRYTADFYTHLLLLARAGAAGEEGALLPPDDARLVEGKLAQLLDHLTFATKPDGTTPLFGDDDGGRLAALDERAPNDFRQTLAAGAVVFGRGDYKFVAGAADESVLWLCGPRGLAEFDALDPRPPAQTSRAFADGGYYVMRDGWAADSNFLMLDCGPHGARELNYGHAHADALSFELAARGRTLLVDPGTYTYTGDERERDRFRSSSAHNALAVDGESSSVPAGPFAWRSVARARTRSWITQSRFDYFAGEHDGYERLAPPVKYSRGVLFVKGDYWIARDRAESAGTHDYELRFQLAPGVGPEGFESGDARGVRAPAAPDEAGLSIFTFGAGGAGASSGEEKGWVSRCYGAKEAAATLTFRERGAGAREFFTFLLPRAAGAGAHGAVRELDATGGRLFEIAGARADAYDLLLTSSGIYAESGRLASDFEWSWARFSRDGSTLEELVLVGGRRFSLYGHEIVRLPNRTAYAVARRDGERLVVETAAGSRSVELTDRYTLAGP